MGDIKLENLEEVKYMTMTRRVRDLFTKRFEENGVDYTGLKLVGLLMWS